MNVGLSVSEMVRHSQRCDTRRFNRPTSASVGAYYVCSYLSGAGVDILGSALVPVGQQLDGGRG